MATSYEFDAIGTHWQIDIRDPLSPLEEVDFLRQIQERIEAYDCVYLRFRDDSLVTHMSREAGNGTLFCATSDTFATHGVFLCTG